MFIVSKSDICFIFVQTICLLSLLSNTTLIVTFFTCPLKRVKSYKYFFLLTAINDISFTVAHGVSMPRVVCMKSYFAVFSTPAFGQPVIINWIAFLTLAVLLSTTASLVINSFLYRYYQLCRYQRFHSLPMGKALVLGLLCVGFTSYVCMFILVVCSFDKTFMFTIAEVDGLPGFDVNNAVIVGFSLRKSLNVEQIVLTFGLDIFCLTMTFIAVFCAVNIAVFLRKSTLSKSCLEHYRRLFLLLLAQTVCPLLLLLLPFMLTVVAILAEIDTSSLYADALDIMVSLYPLTNSLIVTFFLEDYRNFILTKLRLKKRSLSSPSSVNVLTSHNPTHRKLSQVC
ncbi:hypothetical protein Q1695_007331 [Nippostrongylus brasiliensis]|nr:hypothetical protein Q1695_007331 [Nippostrongylus brasiliensis]